MGFLQSHLLNAAAGRVLLLGLILAVLWVVECASAAPTPAKWRHGVRNLSLAGLNGILLFSTMGLLSVSAADWASRNQLGVLHAIAIPAWLRFACAFLALDAFSYFWHRANHRFPLLWRCHAVHHSDNQMDVSTAARFHVGELAIAACLRLPFIPAVGISPVQLVAYEVSLVCVSMFHHSAIRLGRWDAPVRRLIVTPAMHSIHHSRSPADYGTNFASVLSLWDRLFRTYRTLGTGDTHGIDGFDAPGDQTVFGMLKTPLDPRLAARKKASPRDP